jgi:hypothetical protein
MDENAQSKNESSPKCGGQMLKVAGTEEIDQAHPSDERMFKANILNYLH